MHLIMSITFVCWLTRANNKSRLYEKGFKKKCSTLVPTLAHSQYSFVSMKNESHTKPTNTYLHATNKTFFLDFPVQIDLYLCAFHLVEHQNQHNTIGYWKAISPKNASHAAAGMRRKLWQQTVSAHVNANPVQRLKWPNDEEETRQNIEIW